MDQSNLFAQDSACPQLLLGTGRGRWGKMKGPRQSLAVPRDLISLGTENTHQKREKNAKDNKVKEKKIFL